jgi:uncharacterized protein (TIGR03435 family)
MANLCDYLSLIFMDRDVIDKTGITGGFDIHVEFVSGDSAPGLAPPGGSAATSDPGPAMPSGDDRAVLTGLLREMQEASQYPIISALREQLGLKLEAGKGLGEFLVIDHLEKPSEN